jgi:hypothetical protein
VQHDPGQRLEVRAGGGKGEGEYGMRCGLMRAGGGKGEGEYGMRSGVSW